MTVRQKYTSWYAGGMVFWAISFYFVGHQVLGWPLLSLGIAYLALAGLLGVIQISMYLSERIRDYRARLRRRAEITAGLWLITSVSVLIWLVSQNLMPWRLALIFFAVGASLGFASLWVGYRLTLRWQIGRRPEDSLN